MPNSTSEVLSQGYGLVVDLVGSAGLMAGPKDLTGVFQPNGSVILGIAVDHFRWFLG